MNIIQDIKLDYDDVLIRPNHSTSKSRKDIVLERNFRFYHSNRELNCIPIQISNMVGTGRFEVANIASKYKIITCLHKHYDLLSLCENYDTYIQLNLQNYVWYSLGIKEEELKKLKRFIELTQYQPNINLDIANGHIEKFSDTVKKIRELCPNSIIMAGNVVIPECVYSLILSGADIVKCGLGSGERCSSRMIAHIGYPQLSCNIECSQIAHGLTNGNGKGGKICGDGGIRRVGHFSAGFCSGADFLMSGSFFAGTEPTGEEQDWIYNTESSNNKKTTKKSLIFFGMASKEAQERFGNGVPEYGTAEGTCSLIPYKGKLEELIESILGGLRSTNTYIGSCSLKDMPKCTSFIRVNRIKD